ncbi:hypothetical protein [Bradyrhizobium sp. CCGB20]|uniref:hypothetical protein n=1 Tax=Bradyrhizobium sp. CCGB20 TaxID=2949633 RepID=UPI0020B36772|nr:hypothetical protein [Bradyrhizobium sp. CCGB20]MCP3396287.1 hypothetical protein [Bradyrhizobium sp. CCGB20]
MSDLIIGLAKGAGVSFGLSKHGMRIPKYRGLTAERRDDPNAFGGREPTNEFVIPDKRSADPGPPRERLRSSR